MNASSRWSISGDYFENCNCAVVCPCLVSTAAPMTSRPTDGDCHVAMAFHIDSGSFEGTGLDGLNVALIAKSDGPMAHGNMTGAVYVDERANEDQVNALAAIFGGSVGGPMAALAPLFGKNLGLKKVAIRYSAEGKRRSAEIPDVMSLAVRALPSLSEDQEIWGATGHPINPTKLTFAVGEAGSTYSDHGMRWDNSGRNAHYAEIAWSG